MPIPFLRLALRNPQALRRTSQHKKHVLSPRCRYTASSSPLSHSPSRLTKYARRSGYLALGLGTVWAIDRKFNASSIARNFRTLWTVSDCDLRLSSIILALLIYTMPPPSRGGGVRH